MTKAGVVFTILMMTLVGYSNAFQREPGGRQEGFVTNGNIKIHYKLDLPDGDGPFPAVVYGPGSGNISADFRTIVADTKKLLALGLAVMRYDKRGTGKSDGEVVRVSGANSLETIPLLASDMHAVLQRLLQIPEIDKEKIGLYGVSQANWYMPLLADQVAEVRFMIILTGGVIPVGPKAYWEGLVFHRKLDPDSALVLFDRYSGDSGFDQRPHLGALDIPMLYLLGERDLGIPFAVNRDELEVLKTEGKDITLISYAEGVHLLKGIDFWPDVARWLRRKMIL